MGNIFSGEPRCKALWRLESGALTLDSKGGNTLTNHGVTADVTNYAEGLASGLFGGAAYLEIADANLGAGFPCKTGDAVKKGTFCAWVRPNSYSGQQTILTKFNYYATKGSIDIRTNSSAANGYEILWIYSGVSLEQFSTGFEPVVHTWHHVAVRWDGVNKVLNLRIWDGSTVHSFSYSPSNVMQVDDSPVALGSLSGTPANYWDGEIDEAVVFNDLLTDGEIDAIRSGTFVEIAYAGQIPLTLTPQSTYSGPAAPAFEYNGFLLARLIPVSSYELFTPVLILAAVIGSGGIAAGGTGIVAFKTPGVKAVVGVGGAILGGEGVIAFTTPPVLVLAGAAGVLVGGRGVIVIGQLPVDAHVGSGGVRVGGTGVIGFGLPVSPPVYAVVGVGGVVVGGTGVVNVELSPVLAVIGSGGVKVGEFRVPEFTVVKFIYPPLAAIVGSGGIEAGGTGVIAWSSTPPVYAVPIPQVAAAANVVVGGAGVIVFISPQILQVIADGGVTVGGEPVSGDLYATYTLTGVRGEPSIYSGFDFNSYANYLGKSYGAGPDGIYLLEGEDDDGDEIHPGVKVGPVNFGTDREKRLRLLRCGGKTDGAQVKVSNGNGSAGYYDVIDGRAGVSREVQGRELTVDITDFEILDHLEIVPLVLHKR